MGGARVKAVFAPKRIDAKGRVVLPKRVLEELGCVPGDSVEFLVGNGRATVRKSGGRK